MLEIESADGQRGRHLVWLKIRSKYGDHLKAALELSHKLLERAREEPIKVPLMTRVAAKLRHLGPGELLGPVPHPQPEDIETSDIRLASAPPNSTAPSGPPPAESVPAQATTTRTPLTGEFTMPRKLPFVKPGEMVMNARDAVDLEDGVRRGQAFAAGAGFRRTRFKGF